MWIIVLAISIVLCDINAKAEDVARPPVKTARIMPLGDSITEAGPSLPSYRYFLWQTAVAHAYRIDFVGSQRGVNEGPPLNTDFDVDHEGHSGWRADQILEKIPRWARASSPDFILIHLGHNDLCQGQDVASTVSDLAAIIDALRTVNSRAGIVLAQITASAVPCHSRIPEFNAELPALVRVKHQPDSPVVLVDQYTDFIPATMTVEGVHPNAEGGAHMAARWFEGLRPLLDKFFATP